MKTRHFVFLNAEGKEQEIEIEVLDQGLTTTFLESGAKQDLSGIAKQAGQAMNSMASAMHQLFPSGTEIQLEAGISIGGETGVFFTKSAADATFKICVSFKD